MNMNQQWHAELKKHQSSRRKLIVHSRQTQRSFQKKLREAVRDLKRAIHSERKQLDRLDKRIAQLKGRLS